MNVWKEVSTNQNTLLKALLTIRTILGQALADMLSGADNIAFETQYLIGEVCPQFPDPDNCTEV